MVPTLEEYGCFLSPFMPLSTIFAPPVRPRYHKRLTNLLGFKKLVVEALTWYGSEIGGRMSFDFLYDRFHSLDYPVGYQDDFVDLEERWTSYQCQAFLVEFFGVVLFPSSSEAVSFVILPIVSARPHGFFFFFQLLLYFLRPLGHCLCVWRLVGVG